MKVYIAGKVSGLPIHEVTTKFGMAQAELKLAGHEPVNPLELVNNWKATWQEAMKICIEGLVDCDAIMMLSCWEDSPGARLELELARKLGIKVWRRVPKKHTKSGDTKIVGSLFTKNALTQCLEVILDDDTIDSVKSYFGSVLGKDDEEIQVQVVLVRDRSEFLGDFDIVENRTIRLKK